MPAKLIEIEWQAYLTGVLEGLLIGREAPKFLKIAEIKTDSAPTRFVVRFANGVELAVKVEVIEIASVFCSRSTISDSHWVERRSRTRSSSKRPMASVTRRRISS